MIIDMRGDVPMPTDQSTELADHVSAWNAYSDLIAIAQRKSHADAMEHFEQLVKRIRSQERERCLKIIEPYANSSSLACRIMQEINDG